jgi:hypothetical protein
VYQVVGVAGIAGGSVDILFKDHGCTIWAKFRVPVYSRNPLRTLMVTLQIP